MKLKILAVVAVALAIMATAGSAVAVPGIGPQDHAWTVVYSSTAAGANPNIDVTLTLGTNGGIATPPDTPFFHDATTTYGGITPGCYVQGAVTCPAAQQLHLGDNTGKIGFSIQTNLQFPLSNNISTVGGGQPPQCGTGGTPVTVAPASTLIYAATTNPADPVVSTKHDPATDPSPNLAFDQEPDTAKGGMPMAISHLPDWYLPVLSALGVPTDNIVSRNYALATVLTNHTSVNFIAVNPLNGTYISVTVLGDPRGAFSVSGQTVDTCPPFSSTVNQFGMSIAPPGGLGQGSWATCKDYFGAPVAGCTTYAGATGGSADLTITGTMGNTYPYKIAVATTPDVDNDGRFAGWDNCNADANPTQTDANNNGIGDACKAGGATWQNSTASAKTNAGTTCAPGFPTAAPFNACQDADGDGALNSVDNCPLVPNGPLASWLMNGATVLDNQADNDRDGIGNACDPQPNIPGDGNGYAPVTFFQYGAAAFATGKYHDYNDVCDQGFTVGGAASAPTCVVSLATDQGQLDSNNDGVPDFANPGAGLACVQDHASDSNGDGYTDSDEATPPGAATCTGAYPAGGGMGVDPLGTTAGCFSNPSLAKTDVNLDGATNGLDLNALAGNFTKIWLNSTDKVAETDFNGDHQVNGLDLNKLAQNFTKTVLGSCTGTLAFSTKNSVYTVAWDRLSTGVPPVHTVGIMCTGVGAPNTTTNVSGNSGRYTLPIPTTIPCTFTIDAVAVPGPSPNF